MDGETLRKLQLTQLEILKEFKRVCEALNLRYILDSGTLLGAVRHRGFIPWDDDVDVGMLRADYEKFLAEAPALLDKKYFLQTWRTDPGYAFPFAKLRMNDTLYRQAALENAEQHCGIFIDIFPYDAVLKMSRRRDKRRRQRLNRLSFALFLKHRYCFGDRFATRKGKIKFLRRRALYYLSGNAWRSREELFRRYERLQTRYNGRDTGWLSLTAFRLVIPASIFENLKPLRFEDDEFLGPVDYDDYLTRAYGDYMTPPPVEKRAVGHGVLELRLPGESASLRFDAK